MSESRDHWYSQYRQSIGEAIAWCAPRATVRNPRDCLRSYDLRPEAFPLDKDDFARRRFIAALADKRAYALFHDGRRKVFRSDWRSPYVLPEGLQGGRLLFYEPQGTLIEGATTTASDQYFNNMDEPPWDTWISWETENRQQDRDARHPDYLLCWVPPELLDLAQEGIEVSSSACIGWLSDIDSALTQYLRREGYIEP